MWPPHEARLRPLLAVRAPASAGGLRAGDHHAGRGSTSCTSSRASAGTAWSWPRRP